VLQFDAPALSTARTRRRNESELAYETGAREFCLSRIDLEPQRPVTLELRGPELLLCVDGGASVEPALDAEPAHAGSLAQGQACFLPASTAGVRLQGAGRLFRAGVGNGLS